MIFRVDEDPLEQHDLLEKEPGLAEQFRALAAEFSDPAQIETEQRLHRQKIEWFRAWETFAGLDESERWRENPPEARVKPEICIE